jgi:hypothetical protein
MRVSASYKLLAHVGQSGIGGAMKMRIGRWLLGLAMLFAFAGVYAPPQAEAGTKVVVVVGHGHHHRYYRHRRYRR